MGVLKQQKEMLSGCFTMILNGSFVVKKKKPQQQQKIVSNYAFARKSE